MRRRLVAAILLVAVVAVSLSAGSVLGGRPTPPKVYYHLSISGDLEMLSEDVVGEEYFDDNWLPGISYGRNGRPDEHTEWGAQYFKPLVPFTMPTISEYDGGRYYAGEDVEVLNVNHNRWHPIDIDTETFETDKWWVCLRWQRDCDPDGDGDETVYLVPSTDWNSAPEGEYTPGSGEDRLDYSQWKVTFKPDEGAYAKLSYHRTVLAQAKSGKWYWKTERVTVHTFDLDFTLTVERLP